MATLASPTASAMTRQASILLADSDKISLTHVQSLLAKSGYKVQVANDGESVVRTMQSPNPPTIAVIDWNIVEGGGAEICRSLSHLARRRHFYVIVLTRWDQQDDRLEALEAGADECIFKPVDVRELRIRVQIGSQIILERALRESEALFRSAFECAGIGMAVVSLDGTFTQTNPALCRFLGYDNPELLPRNFPDIGYPEDPPPLRMLLELSRNGQLPDGEVERRFSTRQGSVVWAALTLALVYDGEKQPACFVVQLRDITQKKEAEEALRRSEAFQRAVMDNIMDLISVVDADAGIIYASPSHQVWLGYAPAEVRGISALQLMHPDDRTTAMHYLEELLAGRQTGLIALRIRHKDGSWRHMEGQGGLLRNSFGDVDGIVIAGRIVDDRIQAEQQLQAAHAETQLLLHSIPSILIGLDDTGHITSWNPTAVQVFGLSDEEVMGKPLPDCGIVWVRSNIGEEIQRWLATESVSHAEMLAFERDEKIRFLDLQIRRIPSSIPHRVSYILAGTDVTDRKGLEEQLRQAQKLEAIGQLAAGIAHEINTPTQYVGDNTRFLKESWEALAEFLATCRSLRQAAEAGTVTPATLTAFDEAAERSELEYLTQEIPHAIEQSLEGVDRVARIVRAMKEFSHPGSDEKKGVDLNRAIETTVTVARNEWKYIADVVTLLDSSLPLVPCLAGEMNQVFLNLIINAAHAIAEVQSQAPSPGKGKITIATKRVEDWAEISVSDTGSGIPAAIRSRIFEPFFTTKALGMGTGQGLALAHSVVVNRHQGKLWFETETGRGTTFFIRLPLGKAPPRP
ncbi:MAG: PAS domain S-box protein [Acidobacteria bacterium]|nr:PAS domain S-box protein [Acidobacteriota bacterium]